MRLDFGTMWFTIGVLSQRKWCAIAESQIIRIYLQLNHQQPSHQQPSPQQPSPQQPSPQQPKRLQHCLQLNHQQNHLQHWLQQLILQLLRNPQLHKTRTLTTAPFHRSPLSIPIHANALYISFASMVSSMAIANLFLTLSSYRCSIST